MIQKKLPVALLFFSFVFSQEGGLDNSFHDDGAVSTPFPTRAVQIQSDGKIVVAGVSGGSFALARYNSNGVPDNTFGDDGFVYTDVAANDSDEAEDLAIQSDGKIVVAGWTTNSSQYDFALVRYFSDGALDTTFGNGGIVTTDLGSNTDDKPQAVAINSDGKIILVGKATYDWGIVQYNSDGTLDTNFGTNGKIVLSLSPSSGAEQGNDVSIQTDGKIVIAGKVANTNESAGIIRLNTNGTLDTSFSEDGKLIFNPQVLYGLDIQTDGKIVVTGYDESVEGFLLGV